MQDPANNDDTLNRDELGIQDEGPETQRRKFVPPKIPGFEITGDPPLTGAMGAVFRAKQLLADGISRDVAIKMMLPQATSDPALRQQFLDEAAAQTRVTHGHVAPVYGYGDAEGVAWIAMEWFPSGDLHSRIQTGGITADRARKIILDISRALSAAHVCGVFHRDVKPRNIMFRETGDPVLCDFGVATSVNATNSTIAGTPIYMSPEQLRGAAPNARGDFYSLGVVLYEMLAGEPPFKLEGGGDTPAIRALLQEKESKVPKLPLRHRREYQSIIDSLLAAAPADRCANAKDLADLLDRSHPPTPVPHPIKLVAVFTVIAGLGILAAAIAEREPGRSGTGAAIEVREEVPPDAPTWFAYEDAVEASMAQDRKDRAHQFLVQHAEGPLADILRIRVFEDDQVLQDVTARAAQNDPDALLVLSELRNRPVGTIFSESESSALEYAARALKHAPENPLAQWLFAALSLTMATEGQDVTEAIALLEKSAEEGFFLSQYWLGRAYLSGRFVEKDVERGIELLTAATANGDRDAAFKMYEIYRSGDAALGIAADEGKASAFLKAARTRGHPRAIRLDE